jgi:hypothetical protein
MRLSQPLNSTSILFLDVGNFKMRAVLPMFWTSLLSHGLEGGDKKILEMSIVTKCYQPENG